MGIFATYNSFGGISPGDLVTASSNIVDEAIVRGDGGARGVQDSLVFINNLGAISGATALEVDNLRLDGNEITSLDTNGNIALTPNGSGSIILTPITGLVASNGASGTFGRTLTAGSLAVTITDGDGVAGNPSIDVDSSQININSLTGYPLTVSNGGSGLSSVTSGGILIGNGTSALSVTSQPSNGQLLIGSTGNDPVLGSLTEPASGIGITGGAGSITFALEDDLLAIENLASTGFAVRSAADTWVQRSLTQPAAGITISNSDGVSGDPIFALADDLAALEGLASTGFAVRSAADTWVQRSLTQPAAGITISNSDGVSGDPIFALADDLAALEALSGTGILVRTASNTYAERTITAGSGISISDGDGISGNPIIALGAGSISSWTVVTGTTQALAVDSGYIGNNGTGITYTLPDTAAVGSIIRITNFGAGLPTIAQNAGESINIIDQTTTVGVGGSLVATEQFDSIEIICIVANSTWNVLSITGNWSLV